MTAPDQLKDLGTFRTTDPLTPDIRRCIEGDERQVGHTPRASVVDDRIEYQCPRCQIKWAVLDGEDRSVTQ